MFRSTRESGFLPSFAPLLVLPKEYKALEALVSRLPSLLAGTDATGAELVALVSSLPELHLPALPSASNYTEVVLDGAALIDALLRTRDDSSSAEDAASAALLHALFRDYSMVASAYLLEPKSRGQAVRSRIPPQIARPLWLLSHALGLPPYLEYSAYCLGTIFCAMGSSFEWQDQRLIRMIKGGPVESTFVCIHYEIESHSGALLSCFAEALSALAPMGSSAIAHGAPTDIPALTHALESLHAIVTRILMSMMKMLNACDPSGYVSLVRPWIFGTRGNPDFVGGTCVFEGIFDPECTSKWTLESTHDGVTASLRGETGAQSSIVPALDALLGIAHSADSLRVMLAELEHYRPAAHYQLLRSLRARLWGNADGSPADAEVARGVKARSLSQPPAASSSADAPAAAVSASSHALKDAVRASGDRNLVKAYNSVVSQVFSFRDLHLTFAELYITRFTSKAAGTGGTPYRSYLAKHTRESSVIAQIADGPGGTDDVVQVIPTPNATTLAAQLADVLDPATVNGIPAYLRARHAAELAAFTCPSLERKCFPGSAPW